MKTEFPCPICGEKIGPFPRGITFHARNHHNTTAENIWRLKNNVVIDPVCQCSPECKELVSWYSWSIGYMRYVAGHYDKKTRSKNTSAALKKNHWSRGHTKETHESLVSGGKKTSKTLKEKFRTGEIKHWSKGQTKETNSILAHRANQMIGNKFRFYETEFVINLIKDRLKNKFFLLTTFQDIASRKNNAETFIQVQCSRCDAVIKTTVYNVVRKQNGQRCETCDPIKSWVSKAETELAIELEKMFGDVKRWVWINGWSIDMHVTNIDTYVQYDGVYWHGLDRPIEENTNVKIVKKYFRDIEQVEWFKHQNIKLVRVTEKEWSETADKQKFLTQKLSFNDKKENVSG